MLVTADGYEILTLRNDETFPRTSAARSGPALLPACASTPRPIPAGPTPRFGATRAPIQRKTHQDGALAYRTQPLADKGRPHAAGGSRIVRSRAVPGGTGLKSSPIAAFKKAIRQFREVLDNRFNSGRNIRRLIEDRAWCVDQILQQAWQRFDWGDDADIALVAVGGYGAANSTLLRRRPADPPRQRGPGELPRADRRLLTLLWGHRPGSRPERALGAAVRGGSTRRPDGDHHPHGMPHHLRP